MNTTASFVWRDKTVDGMVAIQLVRMSSVKYENEKAVQIEIKHMIRYAITFVVLRGHHFALSLQFDDQL